MEMKIMLLEREERQSLKNDQEFELCSCTRILLKKELEINK